jgi:hypothetical protein
LKVGRVWQPAFAFSASVNATGRCSSFISLRHGAERELTKESNGPTVYALAERSGAADNHHVPQSPFSLFFTKVRAAAMADAYFIQPTGVYVSTSEVAGSQTKTIANLHLPTGSYVITAKFEVAAEWGASTDLTHRISQFGLDFAGKKDLAYCDLLQGGLDTVVLTIAGSLFLAAVPLNQGPLRATARLYCIDTSHDIEIKHITMSAIPVDGIST